METNYFIWLFSRCLSNTNKMEYGMRLGSMMLDVCRTAGHVMFVYPYRLA